MPCNLQRKCSFALTSPQIDLKLHSLKFEILALLALFTLLTFLTLLTLFYKYKVLIEAMSKNTITESPIWFQEMLAHLKHLIILFPKSKFSFVGKACWARNVLIPQQWDSQLESLFLEPSKDYHPSKRFSETLTNIYHLHNRTAW